MHSAHRVHTTCAYCGVGCGMIATRGASGEVSLSGDPAHPANQGRLCAKGAALADTLALEQRLLHPHMDGRRVSWDAALGRVAQGFLDAIHEDGPEAVAFYVSGQLLTEDYYVANKLMKGFIGTANIDTNSRLCMASSAAAHKRAFGEDVVPGAYADFELADLVVLVGSNLAWCHPVLHQRLLAARAARGTSIVVIDPRATPTAADADLHLALRAGTDVALFNGLLRHLLETAPDADYVSRHTRDLDRASALARAFDLDTVCAITGLERNRVARFYAMFAAQTRTVTAYSQGANQSSAGTDKVNAIINCHLVTGRVGRPGSGPFSLTGQPNAMGGREVGGLANTLAAHMEFDDATARALVQRFWQSPHIAHRPGLQAVDLFRAVGRGAVKVLWIMATNPAVSMPDTPAVRAALARCPLVVVSDVTAHTDTAGYADVLLPAAAWGEKDGTVTNSERCISRQRAFLPPPGEARPDWWMVCEVARRMGHGAAFDYPGPAAIFREHAALTALAKAHGRALDLSACADVDEAAYDAMAPQQWPRVRGEDGEGERRLFGDGEFATADGRARFVATPYRPPVARPDARHPLVLNTGRIRDQWHTMTRSGMAPRLAMHIAEPYVEIHPRTAARLQLAAAELACVESRGWRTLARVLITAAQREDAVFMPMHWSTQHAGQSLINGLIDGHTDPVSGQPELKHGVVALRPYAARWYGYAVCTDAARVPATAYQVRMRAPAGWRLELADDVLPDDFAAWFLALLGDRRGLAVVAYRDGERGEHRFAAFAGEHLQAALFVARTPVSVQRNWLVQALGRRLEPSERSALLAGQAGGPRAEQGAIVCACHQVGRAVIALSVCAGHTTVAALGAATRAGTQCGACRADLQRIIATTRAAGTGTAERALVTAAAE